MSKRYGSHEDTPAFGALTASFAKLEPALLGKSGLIAAKREALSAAANIGSGAAILDRIDFLYLSVLGKVEAAVQAQNRTSKNQAKGVVVQGQWIISALIAVAALFS